MEELIVLIIKLIMKGMAGSQARAKVRSPEADEAYNNLSRQLAMIQRRKAQRHITPSPITGQFESLPPLPDLPAPPAPVSRVRRLLADTADEPLVLRSASPTPGGYSNAELRQSLRQPAEVAAALVFKEILDPPVALKRV